MTIQEYILSDEWQELQKVLLFIILKDCAKNTHCYETISKGCKMLNERLLTEFNICQLENLPPEQPETRITEN